MIFTPTPSRIAVDADTIQARAVGMRREAPVHCGEPLAEPGTVSLGPAAPFIPTW